MRQIRPNLRKVTVMLPADLLERATKASGKVVTPAIRRSFESVVHADAFKSVLAMRGQVRAD
jgi:hypothetical protein